MVMPSSHLAAAQHQPNNSLAAGQQQFCSSLYNRNLPAILQQVGHALSSPTAVQQLLSWSLAEVWQPMATTQSASAISLPHHHIRQMCNGGRGRGRARERQRGTERDRERQRETERERQRESESRSRREGGCCCRNKHMRHDLYNKHL